VDFKLGHYPAPGIVGEQLAWGGRLRIAAPTLTARLKEADSSTSLHFAQKDGARHIHVLNEI
jgi:hypothetical protein